jgi:nucleotide-binding universal stress UspA family protein
MIHFNCTKILIPVDFSETSLLAIKHGAYLAKQTKSDVFLLHVVNAHYVSQNMFIPTVNLDQSVIEQKASEKLLMLSEEIKKDYGMAAQIIIKTGSPSSEVSKVAKEINASIVVMGTHGYSPLEELVIGSVALKVITKANCPVMAMSSEASSGSYKKIVMPIDTTVNSRQKVHFTLELGVKFNAKVIAVGLLGGDEEPERPAMELIMHQVKTLAAEKGADFSYEIIANVKNRATTTVNYVEKNSADLIVIMTDQDAELSGFFLGPYSQQVIHHSKVPIIAVKPQNLFIDEDESVIPNTSGI